MDKNKPFSLEEFKSIYSRVPRLCVELVIRTEKGIVMTLRKNHGWENQWHLPGMTVLYGETISDAIRRIAREEAGVTVNVEKLIGYTEYPSEQKERGWGWSIGLAFLCSLVSGELRPNEDATDVRVFSELPDNVIAEERELLERVLREPC